MAPPRRGPRRLREIQNGAPLILTLLQELAYGRHLLSVELVQQGAHRLGELGRGHFSRTAGNAGRQ